MNLNPSDTVTLSMTFFRTRVSKSSTRFSLYGFLLQPPIQVFGLEGRYAHALYSAATKEKKLDAVEKEIKSFQVS